MLSRTGTTVAATAALLLAAVALQGGVKPQPLPKFNLVPQGGGTNNSFLASSDQLAHTGRWLMVYVQPFCRKCDAILQELTKETPGSQLTNQVVVVVGLLNPKQLPSFTSRYPKLVSVQWYADPTGQAFKALKLKAAPAVFGITDQNQMDWVLIGTLADSKHVQSILRTWRAEK